MAERAGFEPAMGFPIRHFQCRALGLYATSPCRAPRRRSAMGHARVAHATRLDYRLPIAHPAKLGAREPRSSAVRPQRRTSSRGHHVTYGDLAPT